MTYATLVITARWLIASLFLFSGVSKVLGFRETDALMRRLGFPLPTVSLLAAMCIELGAGTILGLGFFVPVAAIILAAYVVAATVTVLGKQLSDPSQRKQALNHIAKNVSIVGALVHLYADAASR